MKIGHRGAMACEPENTLASFQKAIEMGADMIELDVHLCKTGELAVIHNESVDRTTNGKGLVTEKTLAELKTLNAGKGQAIPTLGEVFDLVDKRVGINIELKGKGTSEPTAEIIRRYKNKEWDGGLFVVSSFDREELKNFRKCDSNTRIGVLFEKVSTDLFDFAKSISAYSIHVPRKKFSVELMQEAKGLGFKVFVWTVDSPEEIEKLKNI
ncbi:MAG: glycerophosphodiester phosphodiesterase, partial [Candidatus Colwellbacteria bacterium]|nr:glycerophosphodiester phosphodiesterase [Candidatus Colwellbacteria bacterium]